MHELKNYRGVMHNDTEEGWNIWRGIGLSFWNWKKELHEFWLEHSKVSKIYTLMNYFWPKYIIFELKKYSGVIFHDTREWYKIWRKNMTDICFGKWHEEFGKCYREVMCHGNEEWCKIWRGTDVSFQNWHEEFNAFWPEHWKSQKFAL